jgi:hypothetical protein
MTKRRDDPRYCAPCDTLFWRTEDAAAHRRERHPELEAAHQAELEPRQAREVEPDRIWL